MEQYEKIKNQPKSPDFMVHKRKAFKSAFLKAERCFDRLIVYYRKPLTVGKIN